MTITNRLRLNLFLSLGVVMLLGLAFTLANLKQERAVEQNSLAFRFVHGVYEMNLICNYYLRYPEERPKSQWRAKHDSLMKELNVITHNGSGQGVILRRMTENLSNSDELFNELVATYERRSFKAAGSRQPAEIWAETSKINQLTDLIAMRSREIAMDAARILKHNYVEIEQLNRLISRITIILVAVLLLIVLWQAKSLTKSISVPIARLRAGTDSVTEGNLDYRIGISTADELGQLAMAFDTMTERLQNDIAARCKAETEREQFYRFFLTSVDLMVIADPKGVFLKTNPACCELLGFPEAELVAKPFIDFVHPDDRQATLDEMARMQQFGSAFAFVNRFICKDGSFRWLSWQAVYNKDENRTFAIGRDITEKIKQDDALRKSEEELRLLAESMPQIVWITRPDGWNIYFNQQWMDYTGLTLEETLGHGWVKPFHPDDGQVAWEAWENATKNLATYSLECRLRRADGVYKWWLIRGVPVLDEHGAVLKWFGTCTDIDEFKKTAGERLSLEKQLLHAQKLESLGILAGGIAHDFNNILTTIIGNTALAQLKLNLESPAVPYLQQVETAAERAADLARQMLAYSGKGKFQIENIDINLLIEEMLHLLEVSISKKAELRLHLIPHLKAVEADATQMRQIVMNLVINASEALEDKEGVIAIDTGCIECDSSYLQNSMLSDSLKEGEYVFIKITDTGCGMDKETIDKIFDPFFTTKFTGRGLGMAAVLGIVRGHNGCIKVYSEPGRGSTIKVLLPASGRAVKIVANKALKDDWQGRSTLLLVDDEEMIRNMGTAMLQELGFTVVTANDGADALEIYKARADISCVLLDLTMPRMDGEQCFREMCQFDPDVKVIVSSGYSEHDVAQKFVGMRVAGFVQKPYKLHELKEMLKGVLS